METVDKCPVVVERKSYKYMFKTKGSIEMPKPLIVFPWAIDGVPVLIKIKTAHHPAGEAYSVGSLVDFMPGFITFDVLDLQCKPAKGMSKLSLETIQRIEKAGFAFLKERIARPKVPNVG